MPAGKNEAVAVRPVRVARVVTHHLREEHMRERRQRHGRSRMASCLQARARPLRFRG